MPRSKERRAAAVITGASGGIGRALALRFAPSVEHMTLIGRDARRLGELAGDVARRGARARSLVARFDSSEELQELAQELGRSTTVSVLLHAAGEFVKEPVACLAGADFERSLRVNLSAPYVLTRALLGALQRGAGDVVFINSSAVGQRRAGLSAYGASKAGLVALADSLRQECNPLGLRVLSVFLGATATRLQEQLHAGGEQGPYQPGQLLQPSDVAEIIHAALALPRGAEVTDLHLRPALPHRA
ncbi:MAG TPA: SDR family NAD(P)-dependent oxidoreductase [Polyangiaceae bacterium]|jgi:short-subunit dehydrogenase|nr:SDR family NAD(P)-dependent oxidoreductase [Polyangiaceae bacterium]